MTKQQQQNKGDRPRINLPQAVEEATWMDPLVEEDEDFSWMQRGPAKGMPDGRD